MYNAKSIETMQPTIQYKIKFQARKIGDLGKLKTYREYVTAENEDAARLDLSRRYEHITVLDITGNAAQLRKARFERELQRHLDGLAGIVKITGSRINDMRKLSDRLRRIEYWAHRAAEQYCNGEIDSDEMDAAREKYAAEVQGLFNGKLDGFFINNDPRGYALKVKGRYADLLQRDWGGYGILAPEISKK
jgi:hypothetical protein